MQNSEKAAGADEVAIPLVAVADPGGGKTVDDGDVTEKDKASVEKQQPHFTGMTKEELEAYVNDPFWHRLRLISMIIFCVVWICLFAAVIVIVVTSPRCPPRPTRQFWQRPVYRLQLPAFSSAKDGGPAAVGSVAGLSQRLDHILVTLGLSNILVGGRIQPVGASGCPTNFAALNGAFGTVDELKELTKVGRRKGYNVMLELDLTQADPNWASDAPEVFATGSGGGSQLLARYGSGPAWKNGRLHLPRASCDSLNVTSPVTLSRLEAALTSWLNAGISGFLLTNVAYIAPSSADLGGSAATWFDRDPTSALFSDASVEFVRWTRRLLNRESGRLGRDLALFVDPGDTGFPQPPNRLAAYLGSASDGAHAVVSVDLGQPLSPDSATAKAPIADLVEPVLKEAAGRGSVLFATAWPSLRRPADPVFATLLSLTLPGVPCLYYGQELGMAHVPGVVNYHDNATGASETPMQWSDSQFNAGWLANATARLTWINLTARAEDIRQHNLRRLDASGHPQSALQVTKDLLTLTTTVESLQWGSVEFVNQKLPADILAFKRRAHRYPAVLVVANAGPRPEILNLAGPGGAEGSGSLRLMHTQVGGGAGEQLASAYKVGSTYQLDKVFVPGFTVLIFQAS